MTNIFKDFIFVNVFCRQLNELMKVKNDFRTEMRKLREKNVKLLEQLEEASDVNLRLIDANNKLELAEEEIDKNKRTISLLTRQLNDLQSPSKCTAVKRLTNER